MKSNAIFLLAAFALTTSSARGELTVVESESDDGNLTTYKMSVTPAAEPTPALRHRLLLREIDLKQGNAAPYYYRAVLDAERLSKGIRDQYGDEYHRWYSPDEMQLDEMPLEKAREVARWWQSPTQQLRLATSRRHCDWEWHIEEIRGPGLMQFLLQEIQECRKLGRALMLQARVAIAEGRYDDAIDLHRMNYRMARDVASEPLLVCDLVGMAIARLGHGSVIELIAQPDSPNLYWALTELPSPLIDTRESIRGEMSLALRTFPFLLDAETARHSPEEWAVLLTDAMLEIQSMTSFPTVVIPEEKKVLAQLGVMATSLVVYPEAKQRLIASGMSEEQIESMPAGQVVAIDSLREYRRIADELEKWQYIPYDLLRSRATDDLFEEEGAAGIVSRGFGYVAAKLLLPAINAARSSEQRLVWHTGGIRTVEAIRMHASKTGKLPASLDEIQIVPVPENPATGKPFRYKLDGDTAVLDLPFSDGFRGVAYRFEITLVDEDAPR